MKIRWIEEGENLWSPVCPKCGEIPAVTRRMPRVCGFCGTRLEKDGLWETRMSSNVARFEGFEATQAWTGSIYVRDPEGRLVMHAQCTKRKTKEELEQYLKEWIENREAIMKLTEG